MAKSTRDSLQLTSGGNPALVTYALGVLWEDASPDERTVAEAFVRFRTRNREFLRDFARGFADPSLSEAPQRAWDLIRDSDGTVSLQKLRGACESTGPLQLDPIDVLDLLDAAGLVEITGSPHADPVSVRPVAGLLSLPSSSTPVSGIGQRLRRDLQTLLERLRVSSADFFRQGAEGSGKQLVPESVFSAFLALGLGLLGWQTERQTEREAQQVAGRTDLKLRWNSAPEVAIVEVKTWGRGNYRQALTQLDSYFSRDTAAGALVMLTDSAPESWPEAYLERCLASPELAPERKQAPGPAWISKRSNAQGGRTEIDHFLLELPRGGATAG